jgi:hypothetical protein
MVVSALTMDVDGTAGTVRPPSVSEMEPLMNAACAAPAPSPRATTAAPTPDFKIFRMLSPLLSRQTTDRFGDERS